MLKEIVIAFQSLNEARQFIKEHKLLKWIIIPGIIYTLLFLAGIYFFTRSATFVIEYLTRVSGLSEWIQHLESSWIGFFFALAGVMLWLMLLLFYFSLLKYAWLIIGAPVFTYLSERAQAETEGKEFEFNSGQLFKDISSPVKVALRNCFKQSGYFLLLILLSMVPLVGTIAPIIGLVTEFYYLGFSMISYGMDRKKVSAGQSAEFIKLHKGLAIGNGITFYLMHILIVFAPAYAIIGATYSIYKVKAD